MNRSYSKIRHIQNINLLLEKRYLMEQPVANPDEYGTNMALNDLIKPIPTKKGVITPGVKNDELVDISKLEEMLKMDNSKTTIYNYRFVLSLRKEINVGKSTIVLDFTIPRAGGESSTLIKNDIRWDVFDIVDPIQDKNFGNLTRALKQNPNLNWFNSILGLLKTDKYIFHIYVELYPRTMEGDNYELNLFKDCASKIKVKLSTKSLPAFVEVDNSSSVILNPDGSVDMARKEFKYKIENNELIFESAEQPKTSSPDAAQTSTSKTNSGTSTEKTITNYDRAFDYMLKDGKYYFKGKPNTSYGKKYPNWVEATGKSLESIKNNIKFK